MSVFRFKKFQIEQEKSAMKIGTDAVLLGAWALHPNPQRILDIGTGTGVISLMLAQRYPDATIDAIEIDPLAAEEAKINVEKSKFNQQIQVQAIDLKNFTSESNYDLIVCNPPFFLLNKKNKGNKSRQQAREATHLPLDELITRSAKLLKPNGTLTLIYPFHNENELLSLAKEQQLTAQRICYIKGTYTSSIKRILVELSYRKETLTEKNILVLEEERHLYTEAYRCLVKDFYLKL